MVSYEEERRRRVEENKKRLKELGIAEISKEIAQQTTQRASKNQARKRCSRSAEKSVLFVRRSSRVSSNPRPNYKLDDEPRLPRRSSGRSSRISPTSFCSQEDRMAAIEAAEKIQQSLDRPSTVKTMLQSHVSGGFWLSLPLSFAKKHLPKKDTMITLEDSDGQESESFYLAYKNGLSGGWRGFSIDHKLQDGDALVFELMEPTRLKVHIFRAADYQRIQGKSITDKAQLAKRSRR
ncbi:B3 domain-containing protein At3g19184 [Selaginella moellendorffii]|uniref:B3 domain-containing protein At3g19184 n=1 Tax=Selaginella moellendorffii TaxID=88036 RepID=UPI000D1C9C50|nr:B3 domain-containing protein At3g19184 [Selaginella moellendorffii]|eukprot:XP_024515368.1 B3 domain-containing protein At3g19184 [Selaginella moellendorffii]